MSTGVSDEICQVKIKQAFAGGYYCDVGHCSTQVFASRRQAAEAGNRLGQHVYGSTCRLIDLNKIR